MREKEQGFLAWAEVREVKGMAPAESGKPPRKLPREEDIWLLHQKGS